MLRKLCLPLRENGNNILVIARSKKLENVAFYIKWSNLDKRLHQHHVDDYNIFVFCNQLATITGSEIPWLIHYIIANTKTKCLHSDPL